MAAQPKKLKAVEDQEAPVGNPVWDVLRQFRGVLAAIWIFGIVANILILTLPFYMLNLFTRVLTSRSVETLVMLTLVAVLGLGLYALMDAARNRLLARLGNALDQGLSGRVLSATLRNASRGVSGVTSQQLRDIAELRAFVGGSSVTALMDAPFVPIFIWIVYLFHPALGMLALIGSMILFGLALLNEGLTRRTTAESLAASNRTYALADGMMRSADAVESMGMRPWVVQRWQDAHANSIEVGSRAHRRANAISALAKLVRYLIQVGIYATGAYFILQPNSTMAPGALIAAGILIGRALQPVEQAITMWRALLSARTAYRRLTSVLGQASESAERLDLPRPTGRVSAERLFVLAPGTERAVLKGVTFQVEPGEFLGIVGPSGAGKSTLARALVGLAPLVSGTVRLDGADIRQWDPDALGRHIGYLPQDVQLISGTVAQNIGRMIADAPVESVLDAARIAGVHELILQLPKGYNTEVGEAGHSLSAGQRQHIGLARAFYGNPVLLVLDEPNSNMDGASEQALVRALEAARRAGMTVLVISHRTDILKGADKLLVLRDGSVEAFGPQAEVMSRLGRPPPRAPQQPRLPYPQVQVGLGRGPASVSPLRADGGG